MDFAISEMRKSFLVLLDSKISLSRAMVETFEGSTGVNGGFVALIAMEVLLKMVAMVM